MRPITRKPRSERGDSGRVNLPSAFHHQPGCRATFSACPAEDVLTREHGGKPYRAVDVLADFIREPDNAHDPNAIAIWVGSEHIAYVPAPDAARWARDLTAEAQGWVQLVEERRNENAQYRVVVYDDWDGLRRARKGPTP